MNKHYLDELVNYILGLKNKDEAVEFLKGILTPQEMEQIVLRLQIVKKLKAGEPQRQIADELGVGIATITRGSREIGRGRFGKIKNTV
jgi:TrpR family trp operon transcriptional repressor